MFYIKCFYQDVCILVFCDPLRHQELVVDALKENQIKLPKNFMFQYKNKDDPEWVTPGELYPDTLVRIVAHPQSMNVFVIFDNHKFQFSGIISFDELKSEFEQQLQQKNIKIPSYEFEIYNEILKDWCWLTSEHQLQNNCSLRVKLAKVSIKANEENPQHVHTQTDKKMESEEKIFTECKRYIHLKENPLIMECHKYKIEFERLSEENKQLKARVELLKTGSSDVTQMIGSEIDKTETIESLKQELEGNKKKLQTLMETVKKTSKDFRKIVYLLTGYRFDALKNNVYKLTHMFSSPENDFMFTMDSEGVVNMHETPFSTTFQVLAEKYLLQNDSFPAFLAAITLKLFEQNPTHDTSQF